MFGLECLLWYFPERSLLMSPVATVVIQMVDGPVTPRFGLTRRVGPDMPGRSVTAWDTVMRRDTYRGWSKVTARDAIMVRAMVTSGATGKDTNMAANTHASVIGAITEGRSRPGAGPRQPPGCLSGGRVLRHNKKAS